MSRRGTGIGGMNGRGNVIRGPVIMTPLITDNYCGYRARGVISTGPSRAAVEETRGKRQREKERGRIRRKIRKRE